MPDLLADLVEPVLALLGDSGRRRAIIFAGGVAFAAAVGLVGIAWNFQILLLGLVVLSSASGGFVSLSQATLMDLDPTGHERNMARWTLAGSVGAVLGVLALAGMLALGFGWRQLFLALAVAAVPLVALARRLPYDGASRSLSDSTKRALHAIRRASVIRWLLLLELADLIGDVFLAYLALYLVDVARTQPLQASLAVATWTTAHVAGNAILLPLLSRVSGLRYMRLTALAAVAVYPAFLTVGGLGAKVALLVLLGLATAGWYPVLKARLYSELEGASGVALALANVGAFAGRLLPLGVAVAAQSFGLRNAMWFPIIGAIAVLVGLPRAPIRRN